MDRDVQKRYDVAEFVAELRRLADALEAGEPFTLEVEGEEISVPLDVVVSVEHEREGQREELEFQLSWGPSEEDEDKTEETSEDSSASV